VRPLTFAGYLESYVRYLGGGDTLSLSRLASSCESDPRLVEPLLLLAVKAGRAEHLAHAFRDRSDLQQELKALSALEKRGRLEATLSSKKSSLRPEYAKVWLSYTARRDAPVRDMALKLAARERVLILEQTKGVTRYRMAKDLGLNPGNLHAFLAQGNASKLSLARVTELVGYLDAA
jgi:hypothetical protein